MLSTIFRAELARANWWATFPNWRHPPVRFCMTKLLTCSNNNNDSTSSNSRSITSSNSISSNSSSNQASTPPTAEQHLSRQCHHPASALSPRPDLTPPLWSTIVDMRCVLGSPGFRIRDFWFGSGSAEPYRRLTDPVLVFLLFEDTFTSFFKDKKS